MELTAEDVPAPLWAMQLVLRVERHQPPTATAACAKVASAVAMLLTDERSMEDGDWAEGMRRWSPSPRKVVRRARGQAWVRCLEIDGLTVEGDGVQVRAFPPAPVDELAPEVARLQVGGTDLEDPGRRRDLLLPAKWPGVLIAVTPAVAMTAGKVAAQCGHATQMALTAMAPDRLAGWASSSFTVDVRFPSPTGWTALQAVAPVEVSDAGHTEVPPGTPTVIAIWA